MQSTNTCCLTVQLLLSYFTYLTYFFDHPVVAWFSLCDLCVEECDVSQIILLEQISSAL